MRRKQTALLVSLLIFSSLAFVSQTRPQSPVSSTDPNEAEGTESPVTDPVSYTHLTLPTIYSV